MEKLKFADDLIKASKKVKAGFDLFILGRSEPKFSEYGDKGECFFLQEGYRYAKKMAETEGIAFIHKFKCGKSISCYPFDFGGSFVCNTCGNSGIDKDWWKIKVDKDGDEYFCRGLDFINLQESNNYAFGKTFEEAINNYEQTILKLKLN